MASQMVDARVLRTTLEISAKGPNGETAALHRERQGDRVCRLPSRLRRRQRRSGGGARGTGSDPAAVQRRRSHSSATVSTRSRCVGTEPKRHETSPPARFTEASLIKELERLGIGRPSTYAPTIATIVRRGYVFRQGEGARAQLHGLRRDEAAARALRRLRRDATSPRRWRTTSTRSPRGERESIAFLQAVLLRRSRSIAVCCRRSSTAPRRRTTRCSISAPIPRAASQFASASGASGRSSRSARAGPVARRRCRTMWRPPI